MRIKFLAGDSRKGEFTVDPPAELCSSLFAVVAEQGGALTGGSLVVFDLDNQSVETMRPCPDMTELMCVPFWMMPTDHDSAQEAEH